MFNTKFSALDRALLVGVQGGAARVTSRSSSADSEIKTMLAGVTDSIKSLANQKPGMDPMMMMVMMMMGGGGGGGAPAAAAAPPPAAPPQPKTPIVSITNSVRA